MTVRELITLRHTSRNTLSGLGTLVIYTGLHREARSEVHTVETEWEATRRVRRQRRRQRRRGTGPQPQGEGAVGRPPSPRGGLQCARRTRDLGQASGSRWASQCSGWHLVARCKVVATFQEPLTEFGRAASKDTRNHPSRVRGGGKLNGPALCPCEEWRLRGMLSTQ